MCDLRWKEANTENRIYSYLFDQKNQTYWEKHFYSFIWMHANVKLTPANKLATLFLIMQTRERLFNFSINYQLMVCLERTTNRKRENISLKVLLGDELWSAVMVQVRKIWKNLIQAKSSSIRVKFAN